MNLARSAPSQSEFGEEEIRDIVFRSYTVIGSLNGLGQSSIQVDAREALVPDRHLMVYSVRLELSSGEEYSRETFATVSYEDLDRLIFMLDKLAATNIKVDRFDYSEVQYEIDGLKIIVFNTTRGDTMVAVTCDGNTVHLPQVSKLTNLRELIQKAKGHLDQHKLA